MPPCSSACQKNGGFVASSAGLCGVLIVRLRSFIGRALPASFLPLAILGSGLVSINTQAEVKRISSVYKDLGQSQKIYLHAGLITVLEFPQSILEVRLGNPQSVKAELSKVSSKELTLFLSQSSVEPTNLIVKSEKRFYVFDIIPSKSSHQDYIRIVGGYGSPEMGTSGKLLEVMPLSPKESKRPTGRLLESVKMGGQ